MTEHGPRERAEVSMRERGVLLVAVVCTLVIIAALVLSHVHGSLAGLTDATAH